jgi:hypothetical protein
MSEKITFKQLQEKGLQIPKTNIDSKPNGPHFPKSGKRSGPKIAHSENSGFPGAENINNAVRAEKELKQAGVLPAFDGKRTGLDYNSSDPQVQLKMSELRQNFHEYQTQQALETVTNVSPFLVGAAGLAILAKKLRKPKTR